MQRLGESPESQGGEYNRNRELELCERDRNGPGRRGGAAMVNERDKKWQSGHWGGA